MAGFTTEETRVAAYSAAEVISRAERDFNFFCKLALPGVVASDFPDFYVGVFWKIIEAAQKDKDLSKFGIGIPRAHAKTTYAKLLVAWLILFSKKRYFMVVGSIEKKAADIITDIITILESPNLVKLFGKWNAQEDRDTLGEKRFHFRGRNIILSAAGPGGSAVRGTQKDFKRPDFFLLDDIIDENDAKSPTVSEEKYLWLLGTLIPAGDPHNCQYLYLGNKYSGAGCILSKLEKLADWTTLVVGCILEDGKPLWENLHSLESLLDRLRAYIEAFRAEIFFAEWMNHVGDENRTGFKFEAVEVIDRSASGYAPDAQWIVVDPAGGKEKSDDQAWGRFELWDGKTHLADAGVYNTGGAPGFVYFMINYCLASQVPVVLIEGGGYQVTLVQWFKKILQDKQILGLEVIEIPTLNRAKNPRIISGLKSLQAKELSIAPSTKSKIFAEIKNFNPGTKHNVDNYLDVVAHGTESMTRFGGEILAAQHYFGENASVIDEPPLELIEERHI